MSPTLAFFDAMLRGGSVLCLLLTVAIVLRSSANKVSKAVIGALTIGLINYIIISAGRFPTPTALHVLPALNPFFIWWIGMALFRDNFRPRAYQLALALLMVIHFLVPVLTPLRAIASIVLYAHLLYVAIATARDDLVELRLTFRNWFIGITALTGAIIAIIEIRLSETPPDILLPVQAASICLLTVGFMIWLNNGGIQLLTPKNSTPETLPASTIGDFNDPIALSLIQKAMNEGVWKKEGLTITQLASELNLPERRIRQAINLGLGHRNFSTFINGHRITNARQALADPTRAGETILAIAYESGFASLGPFNRAFRAETGQSPTEYRRKTLTDSG
ncbi:MAG: helix-turn-helix domain-containing protein [Pikeienuella sp.]